jgi:hypothetical protein
MRKPPEFRPQKTSAAKKRLRPILVSARLGLSDTALTELQFLEGPPPGGFSFGYVIGFPSNSREHRIGRSPESGWPFKKSVARIGGQQARARSPPGRNASCAWRIAPKHWRRTRRKFNSVDVDKRRSQVRGRERKAEIQATEKRCKRLLHWVANLATLGVRDTNKAVSETRFGGFSFSQGWAMSSIFPLDRRRNSGNRLRSL